MLIVGSEDDEIHASFSVYDINNVTIKARHIVDALRAPVIATENEQQTTRLQCCEKSLKANLYQFKRAHTIAD